MGSGAIIIEQEIEGQKFETVWGAQSEAVGASEDIAPTETDIVAWFGGQLPGVNFDAFTDPESLNYDPGEHGLVGSIVSLHRSLQARLATITRLYITDGRKSSAGQSPIFYSVPLDLQCVGVGMVDSLDPNNVAPSNQTILLGKVPKGFGKRGGRSFIRAALMSNELAVGGPNGVKLKTGALNQVKNRVGAAIASSVITTHFDIGTDSDQVSVLAILNYQSVTIANPNPPLKGQVIGSTGVQSLRFDGVTPRQTNRPSKRR